LYGEIERRDVGRNGGAVEIRINGDRFIRGDTSAKVNGIMTTGNAAAEKADERKDAFQRRHRTAPDSWKK
jgi:hypothetical protein